MKVYVRGYRQKDPDNVQPPERPFERAEDVDVEYCELPDWRIPFRELAESELRILTGMCVHVGPHYWLFRDNKTGFLPPFAENAKDGHPRFLWREWEQQVPPLRSG